MIDFHRPGHILTLGRTRLVLHNLAFLNIQQLLLLLDYVHRALDSNSCVDACAIKIIIIIWIYLKRLTWYRIWHGVLIYLALRAI